MSRNHVKFGPPDGNALHPDNWRGIDSLIDDDVAANRSRFDDSVAPLRESTYRMPSRIRIGRRRRFRELWALVFLLVVLALAGLFNELRDLQ
jgi:hypothetical protein